MGCQVVLVVALLCILQCQQYQAQSNQNAVVQLRFPTSSISDSRPCQGYLPFPFRMSPYLNSCNCCQSPICQKTCTNTNKPLTMEVPENPFTVTCSGLNLVFNKPNSIVSTQNVTVKVRIMPANKTADGTPSVSSSGNATAISGKNGTQLTSKVIATDSNNNYVIEVIVDATNANSELDSTVTIVDEEGNKSTTKTKSTDTKKPKKKNPSPSGSGNPSPSSNDNGANTGDGSTNTGNGGTNPGNGGTNPGNSGTDPGNGGTNPGNGGTDPGNGGTNPGNGGTDPGNDGSPPPNNNDGGAATSSASSAAAPGGSK